MKAIQDQEKGVIPRQVNVFEDYGISRLLGVGRLQWLLTPRMKFAATKTSFEIIGGGQKIELVRGNLLIICFNFIPTRLKL